MTKNQEFMGPEIVISPYEDRQRSYKKSNSEKWNREAAEVHEIKDIGK